MEVARGPQADEAHGTEQSSSSSSRQADAGGATIQIVTQDECFQHVFWRTKERGSIYERPERLRFVNLGLAAALAWDSMHHSSPARLVSSSSSSLSSLSSPTSPSEPSGTSSTTLIQTPLVTFTKTSRKISPHDPAVHTIHLQPNRPPSPDFSTPSSSQTQHDRFASFRAANTYIEQLIGLCLQASELNSSGLSEVPEHLPQGDLYLSSGSEAAILGSIGACYEAIDSVLKVDEPKDEVKPSLSGRESRAYKKAFVNVRPPGHHCTNSEPMGFCWVNNVLIGCMYSYLTYGIDRICIVDIDLHHGNGSQDIVWRINEQAAVPPDASGKRRLMISYSSLHDINSYPCEDGDPVRIKEASLNICVGNAINQFVQNLHLQDWSDEHDFFERLYPNTWRAFEQHMTSFFSISDAHPDRSLIFVSAGFDACEHESEDMSRYAKKLPTAFFHRFARDISRFSETHCGGRVVSVLEGGYSERALTGGSLSYMLGLMGRGGGAVAQEEGREEAAAAAWGPGRLERLVRLSKRTEAGRRRPSKGVDEPDAAEAAWLAETRRLFAAVDGFSQAQNALKAATRREQKQRLLQHHNEGLLDARTPDGPRRSQRHASASASKPPPPPSAVAAANKHTTTTGPLSSASGHSSPLTSEPESSTDDDLSCPIVPTQPQPAGPSIDSLFSNLQLGPDRRPSSPPPPSVASSGSAVPPQQPLPKVKLVWKAGGVFGASQAPANNPAPDATGDAAPGPSDS
ncbi:hypothetical protein PCASD_23944 [Puccinia coronata f. sp. avenae]|uniref:Histone deacetylase domain-containing protein n=1 Tax=Puccinia coronata f. sp. avenae TaxID=200324 RepID=A0A2N5SJT7_9BASI|nr:hypothetical protein PCASD_23944 [Puccinia coronata f. sp. avenae]